MEEILLYFSLKYEGDFDEIYQALQQKEKVDEIDPEAFVIVTDAREVHGEGFIEKK